MICCKVPFAMCKRHVLYRKYSRLCYIYFTRKCELCLIVVCRVFCDKNWVFM